MTIRTALIIVRDWAALLGALGMVAFLTFVPQTASVEASPGKSDRHHAQTAWPSRTAELSAMGMGPR